MRVTNKHEKMKKNPIYVMGPSAKPIQLSGGHHIIAIRPAGKGENQSYILLNEGTLNTMKGSRILGIGVKRYVSEAGYVEASMDNEQAKCLADFIDCEESLDFVEKQAATEAQRIQREADGTEMLYVPFDPDRAVKRVKVKSDGLQSTVLAFGTGYVAPVIRGEYVPGNDAYSMDADMSQGWLIQASQDPASVPRSTEYGGIVEQAIFILKNSGLVSSFDPPALLPCDENTPADAPFPKGMVTLQLAGSADRLVVGIDALDELVVQYVRDGNVLYQRTGLGNKATKRLHIGVAIGSIAAVLVRVADMDEETKANKKAA